MVRKTVECPKCHSRMHLRGEYGKGYILTCPHCHTKGFFKMKEPQGSFKNTRWIPTIRHDISPSVQVKPEYHRDSPKVVSRIPNIIGIILIAIGAFVFFLTTGIMEKIGATFLFHGVFFTFLLSNRDLKTYFNDFAIAYLLNVWVLVVFMVTFTVDFEVFFVIVLLGSLIVKELSQEYTSRFFRTRFNMVLVLFLGVYAVIIAQKILSILNA